MGIVLTLLCGGMCAVGVGVMLFVALVYASYRFFLVAFPATVAVEFDEDAPVCTEDQAADHLAAFHASNAGTDVAAFQDGEAHRENCGSFTIRDRVELPPEESIS